VVDLNFGGVVRSKGKKIMRGFVCIFQSFVCKKICHPRKGVN